MNGKQAEIPHLARALLAIADQSPPRQCFIAGAEAKIASLGEDIESNRPLATSLDFDR